MFSIIIKTDWVTYVANYHTLVWFGIEGVTDGGVGAGLVIATGGEEWLKNSVMRNCNYANAYTTL